MINSKFVHGPFVNTVIVYHVINWGNSHLKNICITLYGVTNNKAFNITEIGHLQIIDNNNCNQGM